MDQKYNDFMFFENVNMPDEDNNAGNENNINANMNGNQLFQLMMQQNNLLMNMLQNNNNNGNVRSEYHIMPDLNKNLKKFNGKGSEIEAMDWINNVKGMANVHKWPDLFIFESVKMNLEGAALNWFNSIKVMNFREFEEEFTRTFIGIRTNSEKWKFMLNRKQNKGEDIIDYFFEKVRLCNELNLEFEEIKIQFIDGIIEKEIKQFLMAKLHIHVNDIVCDIRQYKRMFNEINSNININKEKDKLCFICRQPGHIGRNCNKNQHQNLKKNDIKENIKPIKCFRCGEEGHIKPNCKNDITCLNCGKKGHIQKNCFENLRNKIKIENSVKTVIEKNHENENKLKNDEKYFQIALVNGYEIKSYIDFGSHCNMLRKSVADELNFDYYECNKNVVINGFGNARFNPVGKIEVEIVVDQAKSVVPLYIVPDKYLSIPLLIGQPFTESKNITTIKRGKALRFFIEDNIDDENNLKNINIPDLPEIKINLWARNQTVIPSNFVGFIEVYIDKISDEDILIEKFENRDGSLIPECIINSQNDGLAVPIVNSTLNNIIFNKNEKVAKGYFCKNELDGVDELMQIVEVKNINIDETDDFINSVIIGPNVLKQNREELVKVLIEYRDVFAENLHEIGANSDVEFKIELEDNKPITYRPYRLSHFEREFVREQIEDLKDAGIITESISNYSSPMLIVKKKNGEKRICIDYRALNKVTKKIKYPLPIIGDQIDRLTNKKFFSTLDMKSGYYQIPVEKNSRHLTAFITPDGHYEFLRMPFGVCNGPAIFQKLINKSLGNLIFTIAMAYFDDIMIPTETEEEGIKNLKIIFDVLRKANLKLNLKKCKFLFNEVEYLGYEIKEGVMKPSSRKIECVANFPTPKNVHHIRQFFGLTSYFRQFIKDFAKLAKPITNLIKNEVLWKWSEEEEDAFQKLKGILMNNPVLALYSPHVETEVHTDASKDGLGGALMQKQIDGKFHPVNFVSRQTTKEESRYHSTELETLAVVWTLERFRVYLIGLNFKVITDCNAVRSSMTKKDLIPRIGRWWLKLQEFNFECVHRVKDCMKHVDALSRNPYYQAEETDTVAELVLYSSLDEYDWLVLLQRKDKKIQNIYEVLNKKNNLTKDEQRIHKEFKLENDRVYKINDDKLLWYVPSKGRWQIVFNNHNNFGHVGLNKTLKKIQEKYWFPRMTNYIKNFIGACFECLYHKVPGGKKQGFLNSIDKIGIPFHTLHLDHLGPFVKGIKGNNYILVIIDAFTKFVILRAVRNVKSLTTVRAMQDILYFFGLPNRIITDRGTAFTGKHFVNFCKGRNVVHIRNATATPRANGQCERINRSITPMLATLCKNVDGSDWDKFVGQVQFSLNNTIHSAIKMTPFRVLFNFEPRSITSTPIDDSLHNPNINNDVVVEREIVLDRIKKNQELQRRYYNKKRCEAEKYFPGDIVMVKRNVVSTGQSTKLQPHYKGPYVIVENLPYDRFRVTDISSIDRTQKNYEGVVAIDSLKRVLLPCDGDEFDELTDGELSEDDFNKSDEEQLTEEADAELSNKSPNEIINLSKRDRKKPSYLRDYEL